MNLLRKLNDEYEVLLKEVDVMVMPKIIYPPARIQEGAGEHWAC